MQNVANGACVPDLKPPEMNGGIPYDPMAVTWMVAYSDTMDKVWKKVPDSLRQWIVFFAVFTMGISLRGDWLVLVVHSMKYMDLYTSTTFDISTNKNTSNLLDVRWSEITLESLYLKNLFYFWIIASLVSYLLYFGIGGFLHWYYYTNRRDKAIEWKCQPHKFLSPELERHEIILGSLSLFITSSVSAVFACYVSNGGWSTVYYEFGQYTWLWWFLQWPAIFIYQDYTTYWLHRIYHTPFLYKHFHKLHHKYKQPTAFSVTAIHPVEILHIQIVLALPIFLIPIHFIPFYTVAFYTYYHGIIDHSGVNFKAQWWQPWQPDAIFHDNHHQYFHVNFGFNIYIWDKLHGTYRRKDRVYTEDTYYGVGKSLQEASEKELQEDIKERLSENPLAYRNNELEYKLTEDDLKKIK